MGRIIPTYRHDLVPTFSKAIRLTGAFKKVMAFGCNNSASEKQRLGQGFMYEEVLLPQLQYPVIPLVPERKVGESETPRGCPKPWRALSPLHTNTASSTYEPTAKFNL